MTLPPAPAIDNPNTRATDRDRSLQALAAIDAALRSARGEVAALEQERAAVLRQLERANAAIAAHDS